MPVLRYSLGLPRNLLKLRYLFDFRAANVTIGGQSFAEWFVDEYFFSQTGAGNPLISGFYIDDDWGGMNPGGPSEMNR